jgi:AraC-like DNA-binding protein
MIEETVMQRAGVRFWQPAPEGAPDLICAHLEAGRIPLHVHDEWQFAVAEGPATLSLGAFGRYTLRSGDVAVIRPYDVHGEAGGITWRVLYVAGAVVARIQSELLGATERSLPRFYSSVVPDSAAANELYELLRDSEDGIIEGPEFVARALGWLRRLLQQHTETSRAPLRGRAARPAVERARVYLRDRPTEAVSLSDAVAVSGVAASHLVRSFSREVGLPPKSYHAQVRLALARRLLAEGKSATWVAYECGFADQSHLSRRFKQCYRLTPGAFQAQCRRRRFRVEAGSPDREAAEVASNAA